MGGQKTISCDPLVYCKKMWVVLTHLVTSVSYPFPRDWTISLAKYSSMTSTNVLESQIKFSICLESKAGSGTPLHVFNNLFGI